MSPPRTGQSSGSPSTFTPERRARYHQAHTAIAAVLADRDPTAAETAIGRQLKERLRQPPRTPVNHQPKTVSKVSDTSPDRLCARGSSCGHGCVAPMRPFIPVMVVQPVPSMTACLNINQGVRLHVWIPPRS